MTSIIIEGADASGKTTLANKLAEKFDMKIMKGSSFEISKRGNEEMCLYMSELLEQENIIIDRLYASNAVYAPLYDYPALSQEQIEFLDDKRNENDILTIYLYASNDIIKERIDIRGDDMVDFSEIGDIKEGYEKFFETFKYNVVKVCTDEGTDDFLNSELLQEIIKPLN